MVMLILLFLQLQLQFELELQSFIPTWILKSIMHHHHLRQRQTPCHLIYFALNPRWTRTITTNTLLYELSLRNPDPSIANSDWGTLPMQRRRTEMHLELEQEQDPPRQPPSRPILRSPHFYRYLSISRLSTSQAEQNLCRFNLNPNQPPQAPSLLPGHLRKQRENGDSDRSPTFDGPRRWMKVRTWIRC